MPNMKAIQIVKSQKTSDIFDKIIGLQCEILNHLTKDIDDPEHRKTKKELLLLQNDLSLNHIVRKLLRSSFEFVEIEDFI